MDLHNHAINVAPDGQWAFKWAQATSFQLDNPDPQHFYIVSAPYLKLISGS